MQIIIKNGDNYSLTNIPENELEAIKKNNEVITDFSVTDEQEKSIHGGTSFTYTDKIVLGDETEFKKKERQENLNDISLQELLESEEDYSDLDYKGSKLGELLSDKFFGGNIYKELQLHRNMFEILKKVVITKEELSAEDIAKLQELEEMNVDAEKLLKKFKK